MNATSIWDTLPVPRYKVSKNKDTARVQESSKRILRLSPSCMDESNIAFKTGEASINLGRSLSEIPLAVGPLTVDMGVVEPKK